MKGIKLAILSLLIVSLTACDTLEHWNHGYLSGETDYLSDDQGLIRDCRGDHLSLTGNPTSAAERFWQDNNLSEGNTNFVCKEGKAYEANKVTDCQGNLIAKQSGGVEGFRSKYNLNNGNMRFTCNNGVVTPVPLSSLE